MKKLWRYRLFIACQLALGFLLMSVTQVFAQSQNKLDIKIGTVITLDPLDSFVLGDPFTLSGVIRDAAGSPVADKSISFALDGIYMGQTSSDEQGVFSRTFRDDIDAGTYEVTASTNTNHNYLASSAFGQLTILPALVEIQTVPPLDGVVFEINGQKFTSDQDGKARLEISHAGQYLVQVFPDEYQNPTQKIEFNRWREEIFQPSRYIDLPTHDLIQAGLNVFQIQGQAFIDADGIPVDPKRISEFTIRSYQGDEFTWTDGQPRWIPASRVARRPLGLEETKLDYAIVRVMIDGSNVVNQAQQRFFPSPGGTWEISLILYSLQVSARDSFFNNPVGQTLAINFPDGTINNYPLDSSGSATIHFLARGAYTMEIKGANGLSFEVPVSLSRDQNVTIKVITYLDLGLAGTLAILVALGVLIYGRPQILHLSRKQKRPIRSAGSLKNINHPPQYHYPLPIKKENDDVPRKDTFDSKIKGKNV